MKVLVIRFSSIGDIVLTTPVLRCLKTQRPDCQVHYLTKKSFFSILAVNPRIDKVHVLAESLGATVAELKKERFDVIIDLHHNLRTFLVKRQLGVPAHSFNKLNLRKWLLVKLKIDRLPRIHIVQRYLETVKPLGISDDGLGLEFYFSKTHTLDTLLPDTHRANYVAVAIGGQHATKKLPLEKLEAICAHLARPVVLLGGPEDTRDGDRIAQPFAYVINLAGKLTLEESAFVIKNAAHVITHDTGMMHIAAAFGKPITSVWGNTVPEFGMTPYRVAKSVLAEVKGLSCRPCSKIGYKKCPLGHFKCMRDQDPAAIAASV